jgi:hypothetical protein
MNCVTFEERRAYPLSVEQVICCEAEKAVAKARQKKKSAKTITPARSPNRAAESCVRP